MSSPVPRGRHAPPLEVRRGTQRARLLTAAGAVFARAGYAEATAEAVAREAGMSKATFYEHFANKEECMVALFEEAEGLVTRRLAETQDGGHATYRERVRAGIRALLAAVAEHPDAALTLFVGIQGAGPAGVARRENFLQLLAEGILRQNAEAAGLYRVNVYTTPDDAYAVVAAIVELVSRELRAGRLDRVAAIEPVAERLVFGVLAEGRPPVA
jgi:AcrR family transcriptional regulator